MDGDHPFLSGCVVSFSFMVCSGHHVSLRLLSLLRVMNISPSQKKKKKKKKKKKFMPLLLQVVEVVGGLIAILMQQDPSPQGICGSLQPGLIQTEVMLCLKKMNRLGCGLVNNCLVGCLFCLTCCLFADFCVCLYPSSEGSLQLRLWMAFRLTLVVSFVACPCMCNE